MYNALWRLTCNSWLWSLELEPSTTLASICALDLPALDLNSTELSADDIVVSHGKDILDKRSRERKGKGESTSWREYKQQKYKEEERNWTQMYGREGIGLNL